MNPFLVTLDIDWAPDFMIEELAGLLESRQVRATWFVTHRSPALERLRKRPDLFELGVHPNFLPGSSHGSGTDQVLSHVRSLVPEAVSIRAHSLFQSGRLLERISRDPVLRLDASLFLPGMEALRPLSLFFGGRPLYRVPCFWADSHQMQRPDPDWNLNSLLPGPGLKVMIFHPVHVYLNAARPERYRCLKEQCPRLPELGEEQARDQVRDPSLPGAGRLFSQLVDYLSEQGDSGLLRQLPLEQEGGRIHG